MVKTALRLDLNLIEKPSGKKQSFVGQNVLIKEDLILSNTQMLYEPKCVAQILTLAPDPEDFTKIRTLGSGSSSVVTLMMNKVTKDLESWKKVSVYELQLRKQILNEIEILTKLRNCEEVCHIHRAFFCEGDVVIALEYFPGKSLGDHLRSKDFVIDFSVEEILYLMQLLLNALLTLQKHRVLHRDIKPDNILIKRSPRQFQTRVKLIDFGIACSLMEGKESSRGKCGTVAFLSPEREFGLEYSYNADLWSMGKVFQNIGQKHADLQAKPAFDELVTLALKDNPMERPSPAVLLYSPLFHRPRLYNK